jgi:hypothetical protein
LSKKKELHEKIISLKEKKFPQLQEIDWSEVLRKNPDVLENIVGDIVKVEGARRKVERSKATRRISAIYNIDHSEREFKESFSILTGSESLRKTASKIDVSPAYVHNLKLGKAQPTLEIMEAIAYAYDRHPSFFLEYRIHYVLESISSFLVKNPETATAWFSKVTNGISLHD